MPTLSAVPHELLLKVIRHALTTSLISEPLLVHGQFAHLTVTCRTCAYRQVASVCRLWRAIAQEVLGQDVTFANGCGSAERDELVVKALEHDPWRASNVRHVDVSLRRAACGWGAPPSGVDVVGDQSSEAAVMSGGDDAFISSREVQAERWHAQCLAREQQRFVRLLAHCRCIDTLDIDVGFFQDVRLQPTLLPATLRTLTLRNCDAADTFALVSRLPELRDLTLRLALDWFVPSTHLAEPSSLPSLERFELSTTAFGATSLSSILALLSNSRESLSSLALRNKGASQGALAAFLPVASGLIDELAPRLTQLSVRDIPRCGRRHAGTGPATGWFPSTATRFPRLERLHLTGVALPSRAFFSHTLVVGEPEAAGSAQPAAAASGLRSLTVEDFDARSLEPLLEALRATPSLQRLETLAVACARAAEMGRAGEGAWADEQGEVERWCEERGTKLVAGWKLVRVEGCGW
ncbi:hypothetical protein JCM3775_000245 [Rhodotorula graminis]|uniref:Uncharacterized protein n=1 Tax=Rhodotorula graminis (strain WP1) TaxID=578459 RepID=A0A194S6C0_RHOGW|nr:uncharacterized protein RHOBADRAFT_42607 [Rhodotorula graminis WP1]KPV76278.1 hypothetical protein RHOBADRAFT_42607 [Rhodotorula graminis WP1]